MRIDAYSQIAQMYNLQKPAAQKATTSSASFMDKLNISNAGKDMQIAKQAVNSASDIREDKVAYFKNAIANGTYDVSGEDFADKLLEKFSQTLA